jgi:hypothetical protein
LRTVFPEGFDLDTMAGRLAAIAAGPKSRAVAIDCAGNWHRRGHTLEARVWCVEGEDPTKKRHTHTEDGEDISACCYDGCLQVYQTPATVCSYCSFGHGPDPRVPAAVADEMSLVQRHEEQAARIAALAPL